LGSGDRGREGAGPELGAGPRAVAVAGAAALGAGRPGAGHPPPCPLAGQLRLQHWRRQRPEGNLRGARAAVDSGRFPAPSPLPGDPRLTPSTALSRGSRRDPRSAGSTGGGRGTMRRPWGALLLGALLCAHGKRRRPARADRPTGKVCPWIRLLQDSPPGSGAA
jgi:hypothetical protein